MERKRTSGPVTPMRPGQPITIENEEIEKMRPFLESLIKQLGPDIEKGSYGTFIGDDSSGRLPALTLWNVAKKIAEVSKAPKPELLFVAGSRNARDLEQKSKLIDEKVASIQKGLSPKQKVLIITETVDSGKGLKPLADALNRQKIGYRIATLTRLDNPNRPKRLAFPSKKMTVGADVEGLPRIFSASRLAGVLKSSNELHAYPYVKRSERPKTSNIPDPNQWDKSYTPPNPAEQRTKEQAIINQARQDVAQLSEELYSWYVRSK